MFDIVDTLDCREHGRHRIVFRRDDSMRDFPFPSFTCYLDSWQYKIVIDPIHFEQDRFYIYHEVCRGFIELYQKSVCFNISHRDFIKNFFTGLILRTANIATIEDLHERLQNIIRGFNDYIDYTYRRSVDRPIRDNPLYNADANPYIQNVHDFAFTYINQWLQEETQRAFGVNLDEDAESIALDLIKKNFKDFDENDSYIIKSKIQKIQYQFLPKTEIDTVKVVLYTKKPSRNDYLGHLCLLVKNKNFRPNKYDRLLQRMLLAKHDEQTLWKESYFHGQKNIALEQRFPVRYYPAMGETLGYRDRIRTEYNNIHFANTIVP